MFSDYQKPVEKVKEEPRSEVRPAGTLIKYCSSIIKKYILLSNRNKDTFLNI